jgi:hypothetical protein
MLVIKRRMNTIKQLGKTKDACQRSSNISQLSKNSSLRNDIKNVFDVDLHHDPIKCKLRRALMPKWMVA